MSIDKAKKTAVIKEYKISEKDNGGSAEAQVAVLTERIRTLTEHAKANPKDNHSKYGMKKLVERRKSLLRYIKNRSEEKYEALIKKLGLRK
ncbi:MAG: 30S ribosomal protein S15 [Rickettsiales bacterium]|jgi:small subunit ribosomal protein S15|nr:30S ribosomal protein S15 [Rickettsiales bacterium]